MYCPRCGHAVPDDARYCPHCAQPVEIAMRVDIHPHVEHNLGRVIGVETGSIHGDVYGGDIYEVQVYALTDAGRGASWRRFLQDNTPPYKFLSPYTARDRLLFKGRDDEIRQVVSHVGAQRVVVVYGQAGVGKTSLLAAGVIPQLAQFGAMVVHVQDYLRPEETIRAALAASSEQLPIALPYGYRIPALVSAVQDATGGTLVLVLDQFERLFESSVPVEQRADFVNGLAESLRCVEAESLRLVLAVQEDMLGHLGELQDTLPELLRSPIQLRPLSRQQAREAIGGPLEELNHPVSAVGDLVDECLVPDLDDLTPEDPGFIHPPHLQVVCHWLYEAARGRHPPLIDEHLYAAEARGADGILARYLEETLRTRLAGQRQLAERVLAGMASPGARRWLAPGDLPTHGSPPEQLRDVLERLVEAGLLARRAHDGAHQYGFCSQTVANEVRRFAGPEVDRQYEAGDELERVWSTWLARDALATRGQLRYLAETGAHLRPQPIRSLLLLRSAVARDEPPDCWLDWLADEEGRALIRQLEEPDAQVSGPRCSRATQNKAELLLGTDRAAQAGPAGAESVRFGPLARTAVAAEDATSRQTAALALTVAYQAGAIERIESALSAGPAGRRRRQRRAELRGTLSDASPETAALNCRLPPPDRLSVWLWRIRRRLFRDRQRLAVLTMGGALGAGLGLGFLRPVTAIGAGLTSGVHFVTYFFWGLLLGGALTLGMSLSGPLRLSRAREPRSEAALSGPHPWWGRQSAPLAIGLGGLFFGFMHLLLAVLIRLSAAGVSPSIFRLVIAMGFVAGWGLSLALWGLPWAGRRLGIVGWAWRIGVSVLALVGTQLAFIAIGHPEGRISILWAGREYFPNLARYDPALWEQGQLVNPDPPWLQGLTILDAAIVGIVLIVGMTLGLRWAARWLAHYRSLAARAGE